MPAESESQRKAAGAALGAKRGSPAKGLRGASKDMYESMSESELEDFASKSNSSSDDLIKAIDTYLKQGINPLSVPPEKRFYNPGGTHTGPRGGKFSVVGTEVDPKGNPINPSMGGPGGSPGITAQPYVPQSGQKVIEGQFRTANGSPSPSAPSAQEEFNPDKGGRWDLNNPTATRPWDSKMPNLEGKLPSGQRWPPRSSKERIKLTPEDTKMLRDASHGPGVTQYPHQEEKGALKRVEQVPSSGKKSRWKSRFLQDLDKSKEEDLIKSIDKYLSMDHHEPRQ